MSAAAANPITIATTSITSSCFSSCLNYCRVLVEEEGISTNGSGIILISESDSIYNQHSFRIPEQPKCLFNTKMRIPKHTVSFSLCISLFRPQRVELSFSSSSFISKIAHFHSGNLGSKFSSNNTRNVIRPKGSVQLLSSNMMNGINIGGDKTSEFERTGNSIGNQNPCIWSSPAGGQEINLGKQIFCNRSLNMRNIVAVGFDMDYTLAQYKPETFESLAYGCTVKKLVYDLGYPPELLQWTFDWRYMVRGLVLDKKRGNILKMDRHKYVKVAYHGFREMTKEDKVATYGNSLTRDAFDEPDYALIDTLFSLAEAYMFAQLVDYKDNNPGKIPRGADYSRMYKDVRAAVDLCHRDGTLKQMVAKDPKMYINEDLAIVPMLKMLRESGRATFLVTNSLWDYTNIVMNFLCNPVTADDCCSALTFDWLQYFDVVITGSAKPNFFHEENRANLFEVDLKSGMLHNTDNGTPMAQVGSTSICLPPESPKKGTRVYQGGNVGHLHKLLSIESSSQVLYVGDHIYGDILRSKKVLGWRTMLVVPELEKEVELLWEIRETRKQLQLMRSERDRIEDKIHHVKWPMKFNGTDIDEENCSSELETLQVQREQFRLRHQQGQRECHQKFHKVWGQLMKTGYQNSRFAHQVERFACLYTSQVSNLSLYSPDKYYRPSEDFMPHEFDIL